MKRSYQIFILLAFISFFSADISAKTPQGHLASLASEMAEFYRLKTATPSLAKTKLDTILQSHPHHTPALIEMGYLLMDENKYEQALDYFKTAQKDSPDNVHLSLQMGYLYEATNNKKAAYSEFKKALAGGDVSIQEKACLATIYLADARRKKLSDPFFYDIYFAPSYSSRFDNGLLTLNSKLGLSLGRRKEWDVYIGFRGTRDTASKGGNIPEIFSDNVGVLSVGLRYVPFQRLPLALYGEAGRGYDLIRRVRPRWQDDFRAGLLGYDEWGARPRCVSRTTTDFVPVGDGYLDLGVYSRYNRNWIGSLRVRQGLRVLEKGRSAVDVYAHGYLVLDANDDFYNNLFELGPALRIIPDHRQHISLRLSRLRGHYIKVSGVDLNPYGSHYWDTRCEADLYWRF